MITQITEILHTGIKKIKRIKILHQLKGTAARYGLGGPWIKFWLGCDFFTPVHTSLLHKWFLVIPKGKAAGVCINHPPLPSAKVRQSTATPLFLLSAFITDYGVNFTYTFLPLPRLRSSLHLLVFLYTSAHQSSQSQSRLHNH